MRGRAPIGVGLVLAACAACEDTAPPPAPPATTRAMPPLAATAAAPDDVIVARVDERPVWGSCVAAQARATGVDARAALAQCIDLELAAQEAERRGLTTDPELLDALDRARASAFVEREFAAKIRTVADLPAGFVEAIFKKNEWRMHRQEYRGSFFARIELAGPEGTPADLAAGEAARAAYATLEPRADLFPGDVEAALRAAAKPGQKVTSATVEPKTFGPLSGIQPYYYETLFAIPAIGKVSPPVRNQYGWDILLYTSRIEPLERTREQVLEELFPALRVRWFMEWSAGLGKGHVERVAHDDETLRELLGGDD